MTSRETIVAALFAKLAAIPALNTASRRVKLWADVPPSQRPALFLAQRGEEYQQKEGLPAIVTLSLDILLYTDAHDQNIIPDQVMNPLLDAIAAALAPLPGQPRQTLGGLVSHCWIAGSIFRDPGDLDGDGIAVIPVKILTNI